MTSGPAVITSDQLPEPFGVWSPAVLVEGAGRTLYVSGLTSRDAENNVVAEGDMEGQTRRICENLKALVEAAGGTIDDFVSVTVFAVDVTKFDEIHRARREFFASDPPASTMVEVSRLVDERCLIEINAIAALPAEK